MLKLSLLLLASFMVACASPPPRLSYADYTVHSVETAVLYPDATTIDKTSTAEPLTAPRAGNWIGKSYTAFKVGAFHGAGDLVNQDTGFASELIFGRELFSFLAVEGVAGYMQADGPAVDVWGIPLFVQARVSIPVVVVEPYAGLGLGGFYGDVSAQASPSSTDFVAAGNAFIGIEFGIKNFAIGLEAKYIKTERIDSTLAIEGTSVMLTGTLPF